MSSMANTWVGAMQCTTSVPFRTISHILGQVPPQSQRNIFQVKPTTHIYKKNNTVEVLMNESYVRWLLAAHGHQDAAQRGQGQ